MSEKKIPGIKLKNIPTDIKEYILEVQGIERAKKLRCISQERIVYMLLREHKEMTEIKLTKK